MVVTAGDTNQRLEQFRPACRGMPGQDPEEIRFNESAALSTAQEQALDRASQETPLHWEDIPASDFLLAFASVNHLCSVRRYGDSVCALLNRLGYDVTHRSTHATQLTLLNLWGQIWNPMQGSGITCIFSEKLFGLLAAIALAWLQQDNAITVGLVLLYRASVDVLEAWRETLPQDWQERLTVATPEQVQGDSFDKVVFFCMQRRWPHESKPQGHSVHEGRRLVGLTRSKAELLVLAEWLHYSDFPSTQRFQKEFGTDGCDMNQADLLAQFSRRLGLQLTVTAISWTQLTPAERDRQGNMAAVTFLQQPQQWQQIWSNMQWQPPQREVPGGQKKETHFIAIRPYPNK